MAIDVRAKTTCSIGPLISASISDDYIQESGLIKTSGSCEISGIYTPAPGDIVTFSYTKSGITRRIPRTLRVLSSFADPFRRVTSIELGCKLTYLEDLKDPIKWGTFDDPQNSDRYKAELTKVPIPIFANSAMKKCLTELGISANQYPLTNVFSSSEFDFSGGYVSVLSDLLVSECYCGYLDINEKLIIINLNESGGSGPLIDSQKLIDIGPIGVGQLPGDAVVVTYDTLQLSADDGQELDETPPPPPEEPEDPEDPQKPEPYVSRWGDDLTDVASVSEIELNWTDPKTGNNFFALFDIISTTETVTKYIVYEYYDKDGKFTRKNKVYSRETTETKPSLAVAPNIYQEYLESGWSTPESLPIANVSTIKTEQYFYDKFGEQIKKVDTTVSSLWHEMGGLGINFVYDELIDSNDGPVWVKSIVVINFDAYMTTEQVEYFYENAENYELNVTRRYISFSKTLYGQQAISAIKENIQTSFQAAQLIDRLSRRKLMLNSQEVSTQLTGSRGEEAPLPTEIANKRNSDDNPDNPSKPQNSDNGYRTENKSETILVTGSASARRRIEFSLPYASDDIIVKYENKYFARRSAVAVNAKNYGLVQNRMLFGNRNGMNIQTSPEHVPTAPFSPVFIESAGVIGLYRLNGTSWTVDSNGIIVSTDAMFWGTAGRTS
jgi:hypothetical protein